MDGMARGALTEVAEPFHRADRGRGAQSADVGHRPRGADVIGEQPLERGRDTEHQRVPSPRADDLQSERHAVGIEPDRQRQRRMTGERCRIGEREPVEIAAVGLP